MNRRIPLVVSVIGALLTVGAVTGTTRASWVDQATYTAHSVSSGQMTLSGGGVPGSLTVSRGASGSSTVTATNTSPAAAKNLVQRITPSVSVSTTPAAAPGVTATLTTSISGSCTGSAQGAVLTTAGGGLTFCVNVSATSGTTVTSATVTVTLSGQQVRGGSPQGWSRVATVTIPVTIITSPPVISCLWQGGSLYVTWATLSGATYTGHYASVQAGPYTSFGAVSSPYPLSVSPNSTFYLRITATAGGQASGYSNTLRLARAQGGGSVPTCTPVTP